VYRYVVRYPDRRCMKYLRRLRDYIRYLFRRNRNVYVIRQQDCDPKGCIIVRDGTTLQIPRTLAIGTVINFLNDGPKPFSIMPPCGTGVFTIRKNEGSTWTHLKDDAE
jgi:hypothetical protein